MAQGTRPKTERNKQIVIMRDKPVKPGEKPMSFEAIGKEFRPRLTRQSVREIYFREKKRDEVPSHSK